MTPTRPQTDVLIFVEDPGAANFVAELPCILSARCRSSHLATSGPATEYLRQRGLQVDALLPRCDLDALVTELAPRLILVGTAENPDSHGLRLAAIAAAQRIASVGVVDSSTHLDHRFRGSTANPLEFCPATVIVPDTICRDGFVKLGLAPNRIIIAGHPHWDHVRTSYRSLRQKDRGELRRRLFKMSGPDRTVILFAAEISDGMTPGQFHLSDEYTLKGTGKSRGRTEIVIEEFMLAVAPWRHELHLVLRLHPKQRPQDLSAHAGAFDSVSQGEPPLEVLYAADAVVGMTSMIMVEAALMGRPTLAILPRAREAQWLPTIAAGVTPYADSRDAASAEIAKLLKDPQPAPPPALERLFPAGALQRVATTIEARLAR